MDDHNGWASQVKAKNLFAILQRQYTYSVHSVPAEVIYEDSIGALKDRYEDHQLLEAYWDQLKARTQLNGK
jgi:hypothetical protein